MRVSELIVIFKRMFSEHWAYEKKAAREGCVDCSGAFVYAFKKFGQSIYHGSNTIAREYITGGLILASNAKPGYAVFKWREANDDMPSKYRNDGLGDLYHIGLLDTDGVSVLNAKGEQYGFSSDPLDKWDYAAPLKGVTYEEDKPMDILGKAEVITESTSLNMRAAPSTSASIVAKVPKGSIVDIYQYKCGTSGGYEWSYISFANMTGYVASRYLTEIIESPSMPQTSPSSASFKIMDSLGNVFYPVGSFLVSPIDSID